MPADFKLLIGICHNQQMIKQQNSTLSEQNYRQVIARQSETTN
ncbi:hypothetical protein [Sporomusa paucivorans]